MAVKLYALDVSSADYTTAIPLLDAAQQEKILGLHHDDDRRMAAGSMLLQRHVLGQDAEIGFTNRGRPFLISGVPANVDFNKSHEAGVVVLAVAQGAKVGVDLAQVQPLWQDWMDTVSRGCFSKSQRREISRDPKEFARWWSVKEAFEKRSGVGLTEEAPGLMDIEGDQQVCTFEIKERLVCTVVSEGVGDGTIGVEWVNWGDLVVG